MNNNNCTDAVVEHDFLGIYKNPPSSSAYHLRPPAPLRGLQQLAAMSRIMNQAMLRNPVVTSASAAPPRAPAPLTSPLPSYSVPCHGYAPGLLQPELLLPVSPVTIFYNGNVHVFDLPPHKAHEILKMAAEVINESPKDAADSRGSEKLLENFNINGEDLPGARRKSLQRFLEKRKERLAGTAPYWSGYENNTSGEGNM